MASQLRHWKEKDGRYYARIAIPAALRSEFGGKSELIESLGGDRRVAVREHAAAVALMRTQIEEARGRRLAAPAPHETSAALKPYTPSNGEHAARLHHDAVLKEYEAKMASIPTPAEIEAELQRAHQVTESGEATYEKIGLASLNVYTDYEVMAFSRQWYRRNRERKLAALKQDFQDGQTKWIEPSVRAFADALNVDIDPASKDWHDLGLLLMRAEIAALEQTLARDEGRFGEAPTDPILRPPPVAAPDAPPAPLRSLFSDYIKSRQAVGKHKDGGSIWVPSIESLIKFVGHEDARRLTKRNILDWRDQLLAAGTSAKTVANKHLAAIRAVLHWAHENDRLPTNESAGVRQEVPKAVKTREKGYTTDEARRILLASVTYQPADAANPANRESPHMTAAKRWVPLLCAFTGARVAEMTQLRKEDIRLEDHRWVLRITPDAGTVKTSAYRDVPLHRQVIDLGFIDIVRGSPPGPLFHSATMPDKFLKHARTTAGRLGC